MANWHTPQTSSVDWLHECRKKLYNEATSLLHAVLHTCAWLTASRVCGCKCSPPPHTHTHNTPRCLSA
jgi:hypothetical protein